MIFKVITLKSFSTSSRSRTGKQPRRLSLADNKGISSRGKENFIAVMRQLRNSLLIIQQSPIQRPSFPNQIQHYLSILSNKMPKTLNPYEKFKSVKFLGHKLTSLYKNNFSLSMMLIHMKFVLRHESKNHLFSPMTGVSKNGRK